MNKFYNSLISLKLYGQRTVFLLFFAGFSSGVMAGVNACNANAAFSYSVADKTVTFTNQSTGANKYEWNFGDGHISATQSPIHTYGNSARYDVLLYAYDTIQNCHDTTSMQILITGCSVHAGFSYAISGSTVSFTNHSVNLLGVSSQYSWLFGDNNTSTAKDPDHVYAGSGPYTVTAVIIDTAFSDCSDSISHTFGLDDCDVVIDFTYARQQVQPAFRWQ